MQATTTLATLSRRKLALAAAGLGLLLALMALALIIQRTSSGGQAGSPPITANDARAAAEARFRALNELPVAAAVDPLSANPRFIDMNRLPEAQTAAGTLTGLSQYRFLEWNGVESVGRRAAGAGYPDVDRDERPN